MKTGKRRTRRKAGPGNPFSGYMAMLQAGMEMTELFQSSAEVIARRSGMISRVMSGELPLHHKEFTGMWQEKMIAGNESMLAAMRHLGRSSDGLFYLGKILTPYRKKATSNARRLRKK